MLSSKNIRALADRSKGIDDILAMLLALAASPDDIEILLISVTFGNVEVQKSVAAGDEKAVPYTLIGCQLSSKCRFYVSCH